MLVANEYKKQGGVSVSELGQGIFSDWFQSLIGRTIDGMCRGLKTDQLREALQFAWGLRKLWITEKRMFRLQADSLMILKGIHVRPLAEHYMGKEAASVGTGMNLPCVFAFRTDDLTSFLFADGSLETWRLSNIGWKRDNGTDDTIHVPGVALRR